MGCACSQAPASPHRGGRRKLEPHIAHLVRPLKGERDSC
jgi:hypothetical protein